MKYWEVAFDELHAGNVVNNLAVTMDMIKQCKLIRQVAAATLLFVSGVQAAFAGFVTTDSSFGANTLILDTQTGTEWLKLDATQGLSFDFVTSQLDAGELFGGFSVASSQDVTTLFKDAGVWAPLAPLTSPSALAAGAAFGSFFGGLDTANGFVSQGMTNMATGPGGFLEQGIGVNYRAGVSVSSFDDAAFARGSTFDFVSTWLIKSVSPVPEPATSWLLLVGLALCAADAYRRNGLTG